ncbi:MAG: LysM peptidoglycan-binding domain-containing protein [bacterium]|nr:LysM peptidoglycan-binding domain-containing protein [bacterium]
MKFFKERQSALASGLAAIIIIVVGIFLFNANTGKITDKEKTPETTSTKTENKSNSNQEGNRDGKGKKTVTYHVNSGDSLSSIAKSFYGDGNKWTLLAKTNKLANPSVIHVGNVLTIPSASAAIAAVPQTYTVVRGDNLWDLASRFYGSGYQWFKIRDANKDKVGTLANGRPLITPGLALKIPAN